MHSRFIQIFATITAVTAVSFEWDCTNSLGTCNNACFAVNHGLAPGVLTYDSNTNNRNPRRTASGCNRTPCSNTGYSQYGNSCDEFPFASVQEGGANAILRCVDSTENSSEGGQLGNFYKTINNGQQFDIFVKNYGGAAFCQNAAMNNDGSEFRLVNGNFQNAKRRRGVDDVGVFVDAQIRGTPLKLYEFEDQNGEKLLSLNPNIKAEDVVGTQIWNGRNMTTIVKVI
ncbi:deoxyribonuclease NucA/NucB-domain-containing protein [Xylaria bambusicola]|uniref:deoxyribonuclease NucA/NucB-domain-containing protein n=1 Tax=Xylaria bambusicola TaxID=326684 RepID=UPI0020087EE8|nr:deoxyribonuclease NucA/NucB-domain-containing protein [Xylaria bambusicola]KAI0508966.1 deoxyribonuclease NucA/NucB-domain-containing protein [Xylaria bambusicola]